MTPCRAVRRRVGYSTHTFALAPGTFNLLPMFGCWLLGASGTGDCQGLITIVRTAAVGNELATVSSTGACGHSAKIPLWKFGEF